MPSLRNIIDKKKALSATSAEVYGFGTPEGLKKAWDTRGRGSSSSKCIGPDCESHHAEYTQAEDPQKPVPDIGEIPHLDHLEFMMTSGKANNQIKFDKEVMKLLLRKAIAQLETDDSRIEYLNTPEALSTDHYATLKFTHPAAKAPSIGED